MDRPSDPDTVLAGIGLTADEEAVYRTLLDRGNALLVDLTESTGLAQARLRHVLGSLEAAGLVSRTPHAPIRYVPAPPDVAIEVLVVRKEEQLRRTRLAARELSRQFRRQQQDRAVEFVEVVAGPEATKQRIAQLRLTATEELLIFDKPPYVSDTERVSTFELEELAKGVAWRVIYDRQSLEIPGQLEAVRQLTAAGEQARTLDGLPMKMIVANRLVGLIPLNPGAPEEGAVVVLKSALLTAITMLFDALWERAMPIRVDASGLIASKRAHDPLEKFDDHIVSLLAAGLQDQAISHHLGVGRRTVQRHVGQIMDTLGAVTRFQAGWITGQRDRPSR